MLNAEWRRPRRRTILWSVPTLITLVGVQAVAGNTKWPAITAFGALAVMLAVTLPDIAAGRAHRSRAAGWALWLTAAVICVVGGGALLWSELAR